MTRLEIIRHHKALYEELIERTRSMSGLEKRVAEVVTSAWIKGNNWMGGLSDSKCERAYEILMAEGYAEDEISDEFDRQTEWFV